MLLEDDDDEGGDVLGFLGDWYDFVLEGSWVDMLEEFLVVESGSLVVECLIVMLVMI